MKTFILYNSLPEFNSANQKAEELLGIGASDIYARYASPRLVINNEHDDFNKYIFPIVDQEINISGVATNLKHQFPSGQEFNMKWIASEE